MIFRRAGLVHEMCDFAHPLIAKTSNQNVILLLVSSI